MVQELDLEHGRSYLKAVHQDCMAEIVPRLVHVIRKFHHHLAVVSLGLVLVAGGTHTAVEDGGTLLVEFQ